MRHETWLLRVSSHLDGLYVRTGPNTHFDPVGPHHWFEGDGMLHGLRLRGGAAIYRTPTSAPRLAGGEGRG